jgi:hypothetical protein
MPLMKRVPEALGTVPLKTEIATPTQMMEVEAVKRTVGKAVAKATNDTTMSKSDWADKDRRISRQGLFQACLGSVGLLQLNTGNTLEDYLKIVEQAAERGLEFVNRK